MRTLIIGGTGVIGSAIASACADRRFPHLVTSYHDTVDTTPLDVRDADAVRELIADYQPDVAVFAAPPDDRAGVENVCTAVRDSGGVLVAFSSTAVFGVGSKAVKEEDVIEPTAAPAHSDLEAALRTYLPERHLLLRTCTVFGPTGRGAVAKLTRRFGRGETAHRDETRIAMPTYAPDLAEVTLDLLKHGHTGTVHAVGPDRSSAFTFARLVAHLFGYDADLVQPLAAAPVDRPARIAIDRSRLRALLGPNAIRCTADGLRAIRNAGAGVRRLSVAA